MIIGICGLIGSGKGTVADTLIAEHNYTKLSFADKLKDTVAHMFNWDRSLLEGDTVESRNWREQPDEFWTNETGKTITPRLVLQLFGTDCMREGFYDGIWVSMVKQKILKNSHTNWVIPDVRFPNEIKAIKELNGKLWQVRRGTKPDWWATAKNVNENWETIGEKHSMNVVFPEVHESEWRWVCDDSNFDAIIENNASIDDLKHRVLNLLA